MEMEKEVKMTDETMREDLSLKEERKKELFKQQSDEKDEGNVGEVFIEGLASTISRQKLLFNIPVDEQIFKLPTGPRSRNKCGTKRRTHRYGTKWLQLQKPPTVRARIEKKLTTEARAKYDLNEGEEENRRDGRAKHTEFDFHEDEERKEVLKNGPKKDDEALPKK